VAVVLKVLVEQVLEVLEPLVELHQVVILFLH
jgi:hypothetical protein